MPRLTGPLFSLTARNALGKAVVYSNWRGVQYARQYTTPTNPQSAAQVDIRNIFKTLAFLWKTGGTIFHAPWAAAAAGQPYTDRNRFFKANIPALDGDADCQDFVGSPGFGGALPPTSCGSADGGAQVLNLTPVQPSIPTGWTQVSADAVAFIDGDPTAYVERTPTEGQDAAAPFTAIALSVGTAGTYVWSCWNVMTAPDGTTRYSTPVSGTQVIA